VLGYSLQEAERLFASCTQVGRVTNQYNVENEETTLQPDIWLCRQPRQPWEELWPQMQRFG
jgi:hypothetical protein